MKTALAVGLGVAAIAAAPLVASTYHVLLMLPFMAYAIVLLGLNLLFGYTGLVSFGHALFIGLGAYAGAFLTTHAKIRSLEVILLVAAALGALVAVPVAALCVRYVKIYFGMLTLAFGMLFYTFVLKFYRLTGGDEGTPFLRPSLLGRSLDAMPKIDYLVGPYYYYSLGVLALAALVMWRIVHSPFGLCLKTIRDNPVKAETLGISVTRHRFYAFVISAIYAAVGGALLGPPTGNVDPTLAYWTHSGNIVFMTLLGGFTSFFGPVVGAFVFIYLQNWVMSVVPYWRLIFGAMLAVIVIAAPDGLVGLVTRRRPALTGRA
jgi:branched-chain amino acid transport system permease protein